MERRSLEEYKKRINEEIEKKIKEREEAERKIKELSKKEAELDKTRNKLIAKVYDMIENRLLSTEECNIFFGNVARYQDIDSSKAKLFYVQQEKAVEKFEIAVNLKEEILKEIAELIEKVEKRIFSTKEKESKKE
ncbi:MAG: hypothetical protein QW735_02320 [archaeon]